MAVACRRNGSVCLCLLLGRIVPSKLKKETTRLGMYRCTIRSLFTTSHDVFEPEDVP